MGDELLCAVADGVATVTLNRPAKRNALNRALLDGLATAFERLEGDPAVRVVVVRGSGPAFCSGMDLDELAAREGIEHADLDALAARARRSHDAREGVRAMLEKRKPVFRGE